MQYEVECKYRVNDLAALEAKLHERGATIEPAKQQADIYYNHPARDFAVTDEALRIRRIGEQNFVTYKGPKIDQATKTRREIELPLEPGDAGAARFAELIEALGFRRVAEVRKGRRKAMVEFQGHEVEVALDEVERVGSFAELELSADDGGLDRARACLAALAAELGLSQGERRSYLELLLGANS